MDAERHRPYFATAIESVTMGNDRSTATYAALSGAFTPDELDAIEAYGPRERGTVIAFPSCVLHRVTPITAGTRKSLVVWITGPKFRQE
jgi:hypothetical protein